MENLSQSPAEPAFVQDPYPFYARARAAGDLVWWEEYGMPAAATDRAVNAILRDRRFGREPPEGAPRPEIPARLAPFYAVEAHSMLEAEPPRHTRLRGLVLRAFTTGRMQALTPRIDALVADLIAAFPEGPFDLLDALARPLPVTVIARLIGVPDARATDLLAWSNAMVRMYRPGRTRADEDAAVAATRAFTAFLDEVIAARRCAPGDDLLSELIAAEAESDRLSAEELVSTVILLLNAGHEATVHTLGNGVKALIETGTQGALADPARAIEEILRFDPPLHVFTRIARQQVEVFGHRFGPGDEVACLLASANRDPTAHADPDRFDPTRAPKPNASFGAGIHFCLGAPLARLELARALPALFAARPGLRLAEPPSYADIYHFHGLERLIVTD
ncbi:MAG: cytochrome P450 [Paracoccaceae bacterium]|jgi:unspecific monooxygenase|nr:cytochrome P450 [Paracoccaceae bacterium]